VSSLTDPHARSARAARTAEAVTRERVGGSGDQRIVRRLVQVFWRRKSFAHGVAGACSGSVARTALAQPVAGRGGVR